MKRLLLILLFLLLPALVLAAPVAPAPVAKTGQTASTATGDDGDLEKGVVSPSSRFTDHANGTVTDNLTGLIWLKNANCLETVGGIAKGRGSLTWPNAITWSNALADGACGLSDLSVAGDCRLPNRRELRSLADYARISPALPTGHPFAGVQSYDYWSSSTYAGNTGGAWYVVMGSGVVNYDNKSYYFDVWPVRGGQMTSTFDLAVAVSGNGSISSTPDGIDCGATCSASFDADTEVTLTATPDSGYGLTGWSGHCSGTVTCTVTMSEARSVTATFASSVPCKVPGTLFAPASSDTGDYRVSWYRSHTEGASYSLEESADGGSTWTAYAVGTANFRDFTGKVNDTYLYRVKARKEGYADSKPNGPATTVVNLLCKPPGTVFALFVNKTLGNYKISWYKSPTPGVAYVLEESTNGGADWNPVATQAESFYLFAGKGSGTYQYRVKATKDGYTESGWKLSPAVQIGPPPT